MRTHMLTATIIVGIMLAASAAFLEPDFMSVAGPYSTDGGIVIGNDLDQSGDPDPSPDAALHFLNEESQIHFYGDDSAIWGRVELDSNGTVDFDTASTESASITGTETTLTAQATGTISFSDLDGGIQFEGRGQDLFAAVNSLENLDFCQRDDTNEQLAGFSTGDNILHTPEDEGGEYLSPVFPGEFPASTSIYSSYGNIAIAAVDDLNVFELTEFWRFDMTYLGGLIVHGDPLDDVNPPGTAELRNTSGSSVKATTLGSVVITLGGTYGAEPPTECTTP